MRLSDISVKADFGFFAVAAVMLYFGGAAFGFFAAVFLHEIGHLAAMILLSKCSADIELTAAGIYIKPSYTCPLSKFSEAVILISGPLFGLASGILFKDHLYGLFKASVVLTATNLIPIKGTDGGSLMELAFEGCCNTFKPAAEAAMFVFAAILTLWPYINGGQIEPIWLTAAVMLYLRGKNEK